jgi:hypothetical protein
MTDYRSLYDKDYIGAWDFQAGDRTFTIRKCEGGTLVGVGGRKSKKPVVYFQEIEKGFALNATNGKTIAALYGNHVEKWAGKKITLYKSTTTFGSEQMECIRVRPKAPAASEFDRPEITKEQADELQKLCDEAGIAPDEFMNAANVDSVERIAADDFEKAKRWISKRKKQSSTTAEG